MEKSEVIMKGNTGNLEVSRRDSFPLYSSFLISSKEERLRARSHFPNLLFSFFRCLLLVNSFKERLINSLLIRMLDNLSASSSSPLSMLIVVLITHHLYMQTIIKNDIYQKVNQRCQAPLVNFLASLG
jgi:hypothetical protein